MIKYSKIAIQKHSTTTVSGNGLILYISEKSYFILNYFRLTKFHKFLKICLSAKIQNQLANIYI